MKGELQMITYIDKETACTAVSATCAAILYKSEEMKIDIESIFERMDLTGEMCRVNRMEMNPEVFTEEEVLELLDRLTAVYQSVHALYNSFVTLDLLP